MLIRKRYIFYILIFIPVICKSQPQEKESLKEAIQINKNISRSIDDLATELDLLLSNRKVTQKINKSTIKLIGFSRYEEGGNYTQSGHINLNLRLPNLEKQWKLKFSSYDEEDEFEGLQRNRIGAQPQEKNYGASVAYLLKLGDVQATFRPRLELKDPLVSGYLLKFDHLKKLHFFKIQNILKLFAHSVNGTGQSISFDFIKTLNQRFVLRFNNEQQYTDRDNNFSVSQGPTILYKATEDIGLSSGINVISENRERYHLVSYTWGVSLSHRLFKNVLHYQITPFLGFEKERNFKGLSGVNLKLELIF